MELLHRPAVTNHLGVERTPEPLSKLHRRRAPPAARSPNGPFAATPSLNRIGADPPGRGTCSGGRDRLRVKRPAQPAQNRGCGPANTNQAEPGASSGRTSRSADPHWNGGSRCRGRSRWSPRGWIPLLATGGAAPERFLPIARQGPRHVMGRKEGVGRARTTTSRANRAFERELGATTRWSSSGLAKDCPARDAAARAGRQLGRDQRQPA